MYLKKLNNSGLTFVSLLFSLSILLLMLPLLVNVLKQFHSLNNQDFATNSSVNIFFHMLQTELYQTNRMEVTRSGLTLYQDENDQVIIRIEQYIDTVRRRVNFLGHEIMLFNVQEMVVESVTNGIHLTIITTGGEKYERRFFTI